MELHGPALRTIRERTGITVTELARRVGCTQGHLSSLEAENRPASDTLIVAIARELRTDLAAIIRDPGQRLSA